MACLPGKRLLNHGCPVFGLGGRSPETIVIRTGGRYLCVGLLQRYQLDAHFPVTLPQFPMTQKSPLLRLTNHCLCTVILVATLHCSSGAIAADDVGGTTSLSQILPGKPWPERRQEIERRWLELLGDFPKVVPELQVEMKEVAKTDGITRYHVSFQTEVDDRVTA